MNSTLLWGIIGVLATILVAYLFYKLARIQRYPSRLSYCVLNHSRIASSFPDLSLTYKGQSVTKDLYNIEILVFNTRSSDVCAVAPESLISLVLPNDSKWIDVRIKGHSHNVRGSIDINPQNNSKAGLSFSLLRKNEFIIIDTLFESNSSILNQSNYKLIIEHRIPNLDSFEFVPYSQDTLFKGIRYTYISIIVMLIVMVTGVLSTLYSPYELLEFISNTSVSGKLFLASFIALFLLLLFSLIKDNKAIRDYLLVKSVLATNGNSVAK